MLLASAIALHSGFTASGYPSAIIYVDPATVAKYTNETNIGSTFEVTLGIGNVTNLKSIQFTLYWNRSVVNVVSVHDTLPFFGNPLVIMNTTNDNYNATHGQMSFSANSTTASYTGNAVFRHVTFNITNTPSAINGSALASAISWGPYGTETVLSDDSGMRIAATTIDGEFVYYYAPNVPEYSSQIILLAIFLVTSTVISAHRKKGNL